METGDYLTTKDLISKAKTQEELDLISIITYKDQELSLLTEKYNKLKEAFEELKDNCRKDVEYHIDYSERDWNVFNIEWDELAGIKQ